jgi:uncharacterized protein
MTPSDSESETNCLPGAQAYDDELADALTKRKTDLGSDYRPRTKHLYRDSQARYTNRLFLETSPYLLQHAHNPVNWYPWGDAAFEAAKKQNRPVLLSVGYSTCHWCHVMEEESFEDEEVARFINSHYVAIKVDREERPDIDTIYMSAVQAITGQGGWPMTVWLSPDKTPFFGGTYFPARDGDRGAPTGFLTLLTNLHTVFVEQKERVINAGGDIEKAIVRILKPQTASENLPGSQDLVAAMGSYRQAYDSQNGGLAGAPKFPSSLPLRLLLRFYRRSGDKQALEMARQTLTKMAAGGIFDHVGGGFHRYATDKAWLVPHFEKMLYDNALLVWAYLDGYQVTGDPEFKKVAESILDYVNREMSAPAGGFYSATDADSLTTEGAREEGYLFTWTPAELEAVLDQDQVRLVKAYFGVGPEPNFEGRYILHRPRPLDDIVEQLGLSAETLESEIDKAKSILYRQRSKRPQPLRDDKILTAWNGLMISAYARAWLVLNKPAYIERAVAAAQFVFQKLMVKNRLYRSFKDNQARHKGYLDDYAFMISALLDLYEATQDIDWFEKAQNLDKDLAKNFEDTQSGGFYMTGSDTERLIARAKPNYDGAEPSGNSVMLLNLLRLNTYTFDDAYRLRAEKILKTFLEGPAANPLAVSEMLLGLDFYTDKPKTIVIVTPQGQKDAAEPFMVKLRQLFLPNKALVVAAEGEELKAMARLIPAASKRTTINGKACAYVCTHTNCQQPTTDPEIFAGLMEAPQDIALP